MSALMKCSSAMRTCVKAAARPQARMVVPTRHARVEQRNVVANFWKKDKRNKCVGVGLRRDGFRS